MNTTDSTEIVTVTLDQLSGINDQLRLGYGTVDRIEPNGNEGTLTLHLRWYAAPRPKPEPEPEVIYKRRSRYRRHVKERPEPQVPANYVPRDDVEEWRKKNGPPACPFDSTTPPRRPGPGV